MNHSLLELQEFARLLTRRQARKLYESKSGKKYEPEYVKEEQYYGDDFDEEYYDFEKRRDYDPEKDLIRDIKIRDWEENIEDDNLEDYEDLLDSYDYKLHQIKLDESDFEDEEYDSLEEDDLDDRLMMKINISLSDIPYSIEEVIDLTEEEGYAYEPYGIESDSEDEIEDDAEEELEEKVDESENLDDFEDEEELESLEEILKSKQDEDKVYVFQENSSDIESDLYIVYPIEKKREVRSFLVNTLQVDPDTADMIIDDAIMADNDQAKLID